MRIASFNVENLFSRAVVMNQENWDVGKPILTQYSKLNALLQKENYSTADKSAILSAIDELGLTKKDESEFVILRQNHGKLLKRPKSGPVEVVADGRDSWVGWLDLKTAAVDQTAIQMTARVIKDVGADILAVIEAENRVALCHFNNQLLGKIQAAYDSIMLIDGNDERGIDVGIMTKPGYAIESIVSHVEDRLNGSRIFSRDCPEYLINCGENKRVLIMINHLKSKGYGSQAASNERRKQQAERVRKIYDQRRSEGIDYIAIVGDFNDTPKSEALQPLLSNGSDLKDIFEHPQFDNGGRPGTFGTCAESNKIDYILLSPALFEKVSSGGVWRMGIWAGKNGTIFSHYDDMTDPAQAASDHAAVFADVNL